MLNPYYWYGIIWTAVIVLYELKFSDYNANLNRGLSLFFAGSIIFSIILGFIFRNLFKYKSINRDRVDEIIKISHRVTMLFVGIGILDMVYSRQIPLFSISLGQSAYGDFDGIPILHVPFINGSIFILIYLFYIYIETKKQIVLRDLISLSAILLLMFLKGSIIMALFGMANLWYARERTIKSSGKKILSNKIRNIFLIIVALSLVIYLNGVLANIRTGVSWNNQTLISSMGHFNNRWPAWIPKQFGWAYLYVTNPLANLNLMTTYTSTLVSWAGIIIAILPTTVSKNLLPTYVNNTGGNMRLYSESLNASTGFVGLVNNGGINGMWIFFLLAMCILTLCVMVIKLKNSAYTSAMNATLSMLVTFLFFYDTFSTVICSWIWYIIIFTCYIENTKIVSGDLRIKI
ncbi:hypothetical protein SAMN05216431_10154 [Ligilactobacillus sp. WC1T17]|uniref:Oligosaccharide repeat unit polymerase n=1 Tax=Ligilactobacillus ruminis TaxID=1623 RepID=A0ABY1A8W6_9LACO|nr:hypothetical protein SAMN05216431_10154 [Ligilactobacillus ruminis]